MSSKTTAVAAQCRIQEWAELIRSCQSRPKDMKVTDWCRENGITRDSYYYWFHKLRALCLAEAKKHVEKKQEIVPVPMELMASAEVPKGTNASGDDSIELSSHGITMKVTSATSMEKLPAECRK